MTTHTRGHELAAVHACETDSRIGHVSRALIAERERSRRLREALQFYATIGNWQNDVAECHGAPVSVPWTAPVYGDNGDIARAALREGGRE